LLRTVTSLLAPLDGKSTGTVTRRRLLRSAAPDLEPGATVIDEIREQDPLATDGELRGCGSISFSGDDIFGVSVN
jgi:hypothetical protein